MRAGAPIGPMLRRGSGPGRQTAGSATAVRANYPVLCAAWPTTHARHINRILYRGSVGAKRQGTQYDATNGRAGGRLLAQEAHGAGTVGGRGSLAGPACSALLLSHAESAQGW